MSHLCKLLLWLLVNFVYSKIFLLTEIDTLIFDAIMLMITIVIVDDTFEFNIKSSEQLFQIWVKKPQRSLHLRWKKSILKTPIFCQAMSSVNEVQTFNIKVLHYHTYLYYLQQLDFTVEFSQILTPYNIQWEADKAVDDVSFCFSSCICSC